MADLITRLRHAVPLSDAHAHHALDCEAADEIERLRADSARLNCLDDPGRLWTFWMGKGGTSFSVPPGHDIRQAIDQFYSINGTSPAAAHPPR